jgi:hypothetical protein
MLPVLGLSNITCLETQYKETAHMSEPNAVLDELAQLQRDLDTIRESNALVEIESEKKRKVFALKAEIEHEKRRSVEAQVLSELEEKHGAVGKHLAVVETGEGVIVLKRPNHLQYKKFTDADKHTSDTFYRLVAPSLVYPTKAEWERINEAEPATLVKCANACVTLAGFTRADLEGK